ncbi:MAG: periplasmic heavy metal sensor [Gemmatimonadaceae bacterium]
MQKTAIVIALVLGAASRASSQQPTREPMCVIDGVPKPGIVCGPGQPNGDPLARYLFPPELVMANQQAIGLTDRQRSSLQQAMKDAQGKFIDLQFRMSGEVENLRRLIEPPSVDEARVLAQVDRVLAAEREVKHAQLSLMIRIKNLLTQQQQAQLGALRRQGGGE